MPVTHRERFISTLEGRIPDRKPVLAHLTIQAAEKLAQVLDKEVGFVDSFLATRLSHRDILLALGNDAVTIGATRETPTVTLPNGDARDEWGITYRTVGYYGEAVGRPLSACESVEDFERYRFPDPLAPERWTLALSEVQTYGAEYGLVGDLEACLFELAWNLVGLEKFLMDLCGSEAYVEPLLDKIADFSTACGLRMIDMGIDMIWAGDDFGTQKGLMISPALWRKYFKPRYQRMFEQFRARNPRIKIAYHSCGAIRPLIVEYLDIGLDFLNPLQPAADGMEYSRLHDTYGDALGYFGGMDVQGILPFGSEEDVRREVRRLLSVGDQTTRFILAPAHNIQPDTPVDNILAFFDEATHFGQKG